MSHRAASPSLSRAELPIPPSLSLSLSLSLSHRVFPKAHARPNCGARRNSRVEREANRRIRARAYIARSARWKAHSSYTLSRGGERAGGVLILPETNLPRNSFANRCRCLPETTTSLHGYCRFTADKPRHSLPIRAHSFTIR